MDSIEINTHWKSPDSSCLGSLGPREEDGLLQRFSVLLHDQRLFDDLVVEPYCQSGIFIQLLHLFG